jgi:sporulation protein YlmC with PRC-barrel domain
VSTHHRLSELLGREVVDENGQRLGRVHDVVCDRQPAAATVSALLIGSGGLLSRAGIPGGRRTDRVDWQDVRRVEPRRIVVQTGATVRRE